MISDPISLVSIYCEKSEGFSLLRFLQKKDPLEAVVSNIFSSMSSKTPLERWSFVQAVKSEFVKKTVDLEKVKALKRGLCENKNNSNWKGALLGGRQGVCVDKHTFMLEYSNSLDVPLQMEGRVQFFPGNDIQVAFGSTFATNIPHRVNSKGDHILDAVCASVCLTQNGHFNGYALAIADGAGGHFDDVHQDKMIGRTAHFAVKGSVRFLNAFDQPDQLVGSFDSFIQSLKEELLLKGKGESTTLACCRIFPLKEGFRVIGFNIGDNMVIAWDPIKKRVYHLLPSRCSEAGTALLPEAFRKHEIGVVDTILPDGCLLYLMTDGVHDSLPFIEEDKVYPNLLKYKIRTLDNLELLLRDIAENDPQEVFLKTLIRKAFDIVELLRQNQTEPNVKIGDDLSVIQCQLNRRIH